ncbi:MAG: peptidylprolyl isomerase [Chloroflexota bacterium]
MARRAAAPLVTKKHLARAERERLQRRWIIIGTIMTAAAVIGILVYGWIREAYVLPQEPVASVNGEAITTRQFQDRVRLKRLDLMLQGDANFQSYIEQQLAQIESRLDGTTALGLVSLTELIEEALIRQEAERRGIRVSPEEIEADVAAAFGYYPGGTPTPQPTATLSPATETALAATPTATAAPIGTQTPSSSPTPGPSPTTTATLAPLPTATPYTLQAYQTDYQSELGYLRDAGISEAGFRARYEARLYRQKLVAAFETSVPREAEQAWARHIVVGDEFTALQIRRFLQAGETWESLAAQYSTDTTTKDQGGDLGWFTRGTVDAELETVAFELPVGELSQPVQTQAGWEIIEVLGREVRPLNEAQFQQAVATAFDNWLAEQRAAGQIEIQPYWIQRVPTEPTLTAGG